MGASGRVLLELSCWPRWPVRSRHTFGNDRKIQELDELRRPTVKLLAATIRAATALVVSVTVAACALLPGASPTTITSTPAVSDAVAPSPQPTGQIGVLPADVNRLGDVRLARADEAAGAVTASIAVQAAAAEGYDWPGPEPFLVLVTHPATSGSDEPIVDRLLWLIRWADISIAFPVPMPQSGTPAPPKPYRYAYVLVDAHSSKVLVATYMD